MVRIALTGLPSSTSELVTLFATHPLQSGWFLIQKLGAVLLWPVTFPYLESIPVLNRLFGVVIVLITTVGISSLVLTRTKSPTLSLSRAAVLIVIVGVLVNFVFIPADARYAIPLVLIGVAGMAGLVGQGVGRGIGERTFAEDFQL